MACNRVGRDRVWLKEHWEGANWRGGQGVTLRPGCVPRGDGDWRICQNEHKEPLYKNALSAVVPWDDVSDNFEPTGWTNGGCVGGHNAWNYCKILKPKEHNKYACCTNNKIDVLQCGENWCKEDASNCDTYMGQYCSAGTRLIDDANCYSKFQLTKSTEINDMCKQPANAMKPTCREFCTNQLSNNGPFKGSCLTAAADYCAIPANAAGPDCKCVNYRQTSEYKSLLKKLGTGETGIPDPQCWAEPCKTGNQLRSWVDCPTSMALCIQSLEASGVNSQNVGTIGSACNINLQNSSSTSSSPTPPRTTAPPPRTTAPPPPAYGTPPPPRVPPQNESSSTGAIFVIFMMFIVVGLLLFLAFRG
jgi:hypothetical protein